MALEQFKTQVLLLHSQQSTLDALGAGFNDRYSVHFATSGAEALTTLGETPIHIIVSAQDLPGMSGLEALREAKKRSPDTIGILLAGDSTDDGLEALVGEKEVFQIVRGAVEPDALLKIVENAARRMRMLTLADSANDTAANVDEPVDSSSDEGEHIVMETADNGTSIISDGTGRMPALKPEKIGAAVAPGGREVDVLVLTKDSEFIETVRESARGLHNVHHAATGQQAIDAVSNHPVGVLVTDAAIAGSKVELLTQKLRASAPRLVAIVAGRRDDGDMLMDLINRGLVYRFLLKPVSPGRARLAIEASVKHHMEAPEGTFKGAPAAAAKPAAAKPVPVKPAPAEPAAKADPPLAPEKPAPAASPDPEPVEDDIDPSLMDTGSMRDTARRMAAMAAAKSSGKKSPGLPVPIIAGAAAALLAIGAIAWFIAGGEDAPVTETVADVPADTDDAAAAVADEQGPAVATPAPADAAQQPTAAPEPEPAYVALLDNARFARDSGRILSPAGDNAIEWYVAARDAAPQNGAIAEELDALVEQVIGMAETALLESRSADAEEALQMAAVANPGNPRLNFLNAQLDQMLLREQLDSARAAIRDARFEDAAALLTAAEDIPGANVAQIGQVVEELATARSAQQVEDVIAEANERLAAGQLVEPANDNARYFFELALSSDADNSAAAQGLLVVASRLVLKARDAIDAGELDAGAAYLADARALDPSSAELVASEDALAAAREVQAEAERQAAAEQAAAARQAAAERAEAERRAAAGTATLSTGPDTAADGDFEPASATDASGDGIEPVQVAALRRGAAAKPAAPQAAAPAPPESSAPVAAQPEPNPTIAVSQLRRLNYVAPKYPRMAQRRGTSGWVDVLFTVGRDGTVSTVEVTDSTPGTVFDDAAREAVSQWRFEPIVENGRPVPKQVAVRMSFSLQ